MKIKYSFFYVLIGIIISSNTLISQENDFSDLEGKTYSGKILMNNSDIIESEKITIRNNFLYYLGNKNSIDSINIDTIRLLRVKYGNYAIEGSMLGALFGGTMLIAIDLWEGNGLNAPIHAVGSFIGIGASLGLITGLFYSRQITIYKKGQMKFLSLENSPNHQTMSLSINLLNFQYNF